jgi:hypothetical protein
MHDRSRNGVGDSSAGRGQRESADPVEVNISEADDDGSHHRKGQQDDEYRQSRRTSEERQHAVCPRASRGPVVDIEI